MMHVAPEIVDAELVAAIAAGDRAGVAELYDRHGGLVYGLALRVLGEAGPAEEVTQDVFLAVWRRASSYDPARASVVTWLATIARNGAIDRLRGEAARPLRDSVAILEDEDPAGVDRAGTSVQRAPDPADVAVQHDRARHVRAALEQLPDAQRTAIELAYFGGLSQSEIAERLAEPIGTIKTRMYHGMRRLRELLEAEGVRDV